VRERLRRQPALHEVNHSGQVVVDRMVVGVDIRLTRFIESYELS